MLAPGDVCEQDVSTQPTAGSLLTGEYSKSGLVTPIGSLNALLLKPPDDVPDILEREGRGMAVE